MRRLQVEITAPMGAVARHAVDRGSRKTVSAEPGAEEGHNRAGTSRMFSAVDASILVQCKSQKLRRPGLEQGTRRLIAIKPQERRNVGKAIGTLLPA